MTVQDAAVRGLDEILAASAATEDFKDAMRGLSAGTPHTAIEFNEASPPIKVLRFAMKLLDMNPEIEFSSLQIEGESSCAGYVGTATAQPGDMTIEFDWDCAWKADECGWKDAFGDPNQLRAAQTFGYQCFKTFSAVGG